MPHWHHALPPPPPQMLFLHFSRQVVRDNMSDYMDMDM